MLGRQRTCAQLGPRRYGRHFLLFVVMMIRPTPGQVPYSRWAAAGLLIFTRSTSFASTSRPRGRPPPPFEAFHAAHRPPIRMLTYPKGGGPPRNRKPWPQSAFGVG